MQTPMLMEARRLSDHMKILCKVGVFEQWSGGDKRETEDVIRPGVVRKAEDGSGSFEFDCGQLLFPHVRLRD